MPCGQSIAIRLMVKGWLSAMGVDPVSQAVISRAVGWTTAAVTMDLHSHAAMEAFDLAHDAYNFTEAAHGVSSAADVVHGASSAADVAHGVSMHGGADVPHYYSDGSYRYHGKVYPPEPDIRHYDSAGYYTYHDNVYTPDGKYIDDNPVNALNVAGSPPSLPNLETLLDTPLSVLHEVSQGDLIGIGEELIEWANEIPNLPNSLASLAKALEFALERAQDDHYLQGYISQYREAQVRDAAVAMIQTLRHR